MITEHTTIPTDFATLVDKAKEMTRNSYAPYSNFRVGAAVLMSDGSVITGANQENAAYGDSICAERVALLFATANYPELKPVALAIAAYSNGKFTEDYISPCGSCRQVISEMENRFTCSIKIIMYGTSKSCIVDTIKDLLPLTFGENTLK